MKIKYLSAVDKTQLDFFLKYIYQKASKLARHLFTFLGIEKFLYFTLFVGWDGFFQNQCYGVNQISSPSSWLWNCSYFMYLSAWLEIQSAFTAKGEGWVPPEEIQLSGVFCFLWGDKTLHLGSVKKPQAWSLLCILDFWVWRWCKHSCGRSSAVPCLRTSSLCEKLEFV